MFEVTESKVVCLLMRKKNGKCEKVGKKFAKRKTSVFFRKKMVAEFEREGIKHVINKFTFSPVADAIKFESPSQLLHLF